jgi:hypothetical protein
MPSPPRKPDNDFVRRIANKKTIKKKNPSVFRILLISRRIQGFLQRIAKGIRTSICLVLGLVRLEEMGNLRNEGIIRVRISEKTCHTEENLADGESRRPLLFKDIETDESRCIDVGMVNLGNELELRRLERIINRKQNLKLEDPSCIGAVGRTKNHTLPPEHIITNRTSTAVRRRITLEISQLFLNTP